MGSNVHYRENGSGVEDNYIEIVERKGLGHPDTAIDGIMESVSRELCRSYIDEFGAILHHNVDKGLIVGGESKVEFGGGTIERPIEIIMAGRAAYGAGGKNINVDGIALETARKYIDSNFRHLNCDTDVVLTPKIGKGSADLVSIFKGAGKVPLANDTSFGVGFAPLSALEGIVLETEQYLNSERHKKVRAHLGEDIKVMGLREGNRMRITVAGAFVSAHVDDLKDYIEKKGQAVSDITEFIGKMHEGPVEVFLNTGDDYKSGSVYITKTGLSMEMGDDGEVGRGNRANGLITPYRRMSLEAAAGKNPVSHVGKIYNVLANEVARDIVAQYDFVESATFTIVSQIGMPINMPKAADLEVRLAKGHTLDGVRPKLEYIVEAWLENITEITERIVYGRARIY